VSSEELGRRIGVTPEQIRKDLAGFGAFGKKGVGYHVAELLNNIGVILGLDRRWSFAIVGVGHLGWALANYRNFASMGFHLSALFDQIRLLSDNLSMVWKCCRWQNLKKPSLNATFRLGYRGSFRRSPDSDRPNGHRRHPRHLEFCANSHSSSRICSTGE